MLVFPVSAVTIPDDVIIGLGNANLSVDNLTSDSFIVENDTFSFYISDNWHSLQLSDTESDSNVWFSISTWTSSQKVWTVSSDTQQIITHMIGGFPANRNIIVYRDGVKYDTIHSDSSGALTWVYDGGFSEHTFSMIVGSTDTNSFPIYHQLLGALVLGAMVIFVLAAAILIGILYHFKNGESFDPISLTLGLLSAIVVFSIAAIILSKLLTL
ncbi:hypothetical protein [Methanosarcina horonobensis]|nr:hypothetical protein [Methanosarcina horonobensis]